jgi:hypothetical protein
MSKYYQPLVFIHVDIKTILEPLAFRSVSLHNASEQEKDIRDHIESIVGTNKKMRNWSPHYKQLVPML